MCLLSRLFLNSLLAKECIVYVINLKRYILLIYLKKLLKVLECMVEFLKSVVNDNVTNIKCIIYGILNNKVLNSKITKNDKKIFVYLSGFYQNLGDMAITYSQEQFLKKNFPEYKIIMVPSVDTYTTIRWVKSIVNNDDYYDCWWRKYG